MSHKWAPLWLAIAGGMLLIASSKRDDGPQPGKLTEIDIAYRNEADLVIVAITGAIARLEDGRLTTDVETRDWLAEAAKEAHNQAFKPVAEADAKAFADGWSKERHLERLRAMIAPVK